MIPLPRWLPLFILMLCVGCARERRPIPPPLRTWGSLALNTIERDFAVEPTIDSLYLEQLAPGARPPAPARTAFLWPAGVQLSALAAAARVEAGYRDRLSRYADAMLQQYRAEARGFVGLAVLPGQQREPDRYYDDNAWIVLGLIETYEVCADRKYLASAEELFRFVLSGEDETLGGGIWWRERERKSKNTCSNAPAIVAALRLYEITRDPQHLACARRLYDWLNHTLQDADGLYFDNISAGGAIEQTKWSYNTALMIRANLLRHRIERDPRFLDEAKRIARAALARWVRPADGAIADEAPFAHLLCDALLELSETTGEPHWRQRVLEALAFLQHRARDPMGYFGKRWDAAPDEGHAPRLIDQASAARAFWRSAWREQR